MQKHLTGYASSPCRFFKVIAELAFLGKVDALCFLLFTQLQTVADYLGFTVLAMLSGSKVALLDGTFIAETLGAFEEQLHPLAATETTYCICVTCQFFFSFLEPVYRFGDPSSRKFSD